MIAVVPVMMSPAKYRQKFITSAMERAYCPCSRDVVILADSLPHRWAGHAYFGRAFFPVMQNSIPLFTTGTHTDGHLPVFMGVDSIR
jgi:hypothetical protein